MDVAEDQSLLTLRETFRRQIELSRGKAPPSLADRLDRLKRLRDVVTQNEARLASEISADFGNRSQTETVIAEILFVLSEIRHAEKHLKSWMAPKRIATQPQFWPARNRLMPQPLGVVGVIAPWNYPLQLTLAPAVAALAAGNRVMIKPSELASRFSSLLRQIVEAKFDAAEMFVAPADEQTAKAFASLPFDHLMFTGSTRVGRLVAEAAGRNLTPVTLELGGKSPAIIDRSADIDEAAQRIAYGKLLNAGQTCIAPDYALVPSPLADTFADKVHSHMVAMYGREPDNSDYTSIISDRHYARLESLVADAAAQGARIIQVAKSDDVAWKSLRKFPPTLIVGVAADMAIMKEEIFGPILPVMTCDSTNEAIAHINGRDRPLALYWFGQDAAARDKVLSRTVAGGVTINDCLFHFTQLNQPMGGVGASGSGAYHGEWGFRALSKLKPVFYRSRFNRFADLYPPYGRRIARLQKMLRMLS
jgi:coniferyl-aldehyde dehydrogenase